MSSKISTRILPASAGAISEAAQILRSGGLVAFPTETVYGLGADATDGEAIARLYAAKGRPSFNPLIAHVADAEVARRVAQFNADADLLARAFWPGPLTLVLPKAPGCPIADLATAGLDTVAVRVPNHPVAHDLLAAFGKPIVAPSANRSGHISPTTAQHVLEDLAGHIDVVLDGGSTEVGLESTIVALLGGEPLLLRPGGVTRADIHDVIGRSITEASSWRDAPLAPGMLPSHYAPKAQLRLNATTFGPDEALLAFGPVPAAATKPLYVLNLSPRGNLIEAAANLFSHLRALDRSAKKIAVMPIPHEGLGEAINDRLARAAAPR